MITLLDEKERFFSQPKSMIYQKKGYLKRHDSYYVGVGSTSVDSRVSYPRTMSNLEDIEEEISESVVVEKESGSFIKKQYESIGAGGSGSF